MTLARTKPRDPKDLEYLEPWEDMTPEQFLGLAYPITEDEGPEAEPTAIPPLEFLRSEEAFETMNNTWPYLAGHLLGVSDIRELALVQDDDPPPPGSEEEGMGISGPISDHWNEFVEDPDVPNLEDTGYATIQVGWIYGFRVVQFYDTGYSAFVFRVKDIAQYLRPERAAQVERISKEVLNNLRTMKADLDRKAKGGAKD